MEHVKPKYGVETVTKNLRPPTQTAFNSEEKNLQKSLALVPLSRNGSSLGLLIIQKTTNNPRNLFSYNTNTVSKHTIPFILERHARFSAYLPPAKVIHMLPTLQQQNKLA